MKKIIVLVLDGFGIGAMDDVSVVRPQDIGSNTALHILKETHVHLPNLEKLGLINAMGTTTGSMKPSDTANFGSSKLAHYGGDTFFGHQEIMGTKPKKPFKMPFNEVIDIVEMNLKNKGYPTKRITKDNVSLLSIYDEVYIGDNLETDLGQVYNVTTSFDYVNFQDVKKIARIVRDSVEVARVIVFGGANVTKEDLVNAIETKNETYIGVNAPKSKVYIQKYEVEHLGYGVDHTTQIQTILYDQKLSKTAFVGKVADICANENGDSYSIVPTGEVLTKTIELIRNDKHGFICSNVQETDLAGHSENTQLYASKLLVVDEYIPQIINLLDENDVLIIMADHGNDPTVGHSKHTRENVPLLVYKKGIQGINIGNRDTLADVGATVADFFGIKKVNFGTSFLGKLLSN
ncbi:Phosphopentomutase [Candidatus Izimaplasma bacterium HR1]|jgi:phosphopentomutase|uniref:phosphopentomutase n=1 Tax=Candidatus Izimoplasma sp. HR1 TaxID=1541959 RepID=UPI0004F5B0BA|nr:Phosphopentomutase [Candidatus Izimaplasma bacterium HR1]